jgi:hypothetical protein
MRATTTLVVIAAAADALLTLAMDCGGEAQSWGAWSA